MRETERQLPSDILESTQFDYELLSMVEAKCFGFIEADIRLREPSIYGAIPDFDEALSMGFLDCVSCALETQSEHPEVADQAREAAARIWHDSVRVQNDTPEERENTWLQMLEDAAAYFEKLRKLMQQDKAVFYAAGGEAYRIFMRQLTEADEYFKDEELTVPRETYRAVLNETPYPFNALVQKIDVRLLLRRAIS